MGNRVVGMHECVCEVLAEPNKERELEIIAADDRINHMEEEINDLAIESLALLAPVASDLRKVIAAIKIASELERIGDYAKNISKFLIKNDHLTDIVCDYAISMEKDLIGMLEKAMQCMVDQDEEAAFAIPESDHRINQQMKDIREKLLGQNDIDKEQLLDELFEISAMLRNIERAGDHVKNICEHILYMMKGPALRFRIIMKDPAVRQGGMALNLEIRTERLTNSVVSMCETLCSQHEICIQMLERKEYQTAYKVMKKEQRISRMAEMINHQVMELMPLVQPVPATLRRLLVSSHVSFELLHMRSSARAAAEFADSCEDEELRIYVEELERSLILTLRVVIGMYDRDSLDDMKTAAQRIAMTESIIGEFTRMTNAESTWPQLTESIRQMLCGIRNICEDVSYLCTGEIKETSELRS